jgi:hypothetical protein
MTAEVAYLKGELLKERALKELLERENRRMLWATLWQISAFFAAGLLLGWIAHGLFA